MVVGEGLKNAAGEEIGADKTRLDAFGHPVLSGAAERLAEIVQDKLNLKTRTVKLGYAQRAAAHYASAPIRGSRRLRRSRGPRRDRWQERFHGEDCSHSEPALQMDHRSCSLWVISPMWNILFRAIG